MPLSLFKVAPSPRPLNYVSIKGTSFWTLALPVTCPPPGGLHQARTWHTTCTWCSTAQRSRGTWMGVAPTVAILPEQRGITKRKRYRWTNISQHGVVCQSAAANWMKLGVGESCLPDGGEASRARSAFHSDVHLTLRHCHHRSHQCTNAHTHAHARTPFYSYQDSAFCHEDTNHTIRQNPLEPKMLIGLPIGKPMGTLCPFIKLGYRMSSWTLFKGTVVTVLSDQKNWLIKYFRK